MTDSNIDAYLEKEIISNGKTVTYRLLSHKLSIHANAAKNALASFYTQRRENKEAIYATFWLSGEPHEHLTNGTDEEMEVDNEDGRDWLTRRVIIVGEEDLEHAKAAFSKIYSLHVYSLSAAPLTTSLQLCGPSREVRELDKTGGNDLARSVGKIVSQQVKRGASTQKTKKSSTSTKPLVSTPSITKTEPKETLKQKPKPSNSLTIASEVGKPKASGKLSWAKAKPKDASKDSFIAKSSLKTEEVKKEPISSIDRKRGTKRKSDVTSQIHRREEEEESDEELVPKLETKAADTAKMHVEETSSAARVKKGVVLSDDEEASITAMAKNSTKGRLRGVDESNTERSIRAIMDIDDAYVTKASKRTPVTPSEEEAEEPPVTDHVDSAKDEDSDDPAPKTKPRKRKQKKDVPIGRNGLPKKRIVKSKTDIDEKGYMVTMDYSSYESVDEETAEEQKSQPRPKTAKMKKSSTQQKGNLPVSELETMAQTEKRDITNGASKKTEERKPSGKPSGSKQGKADPPQKSLASFFGPGGGKSKK